MLRFLQPFVCALLILLPHAAAQGDPAVDPRRAELNDSAAKQLSELARSASTSKLHSLAHELATLVVEHYAPDSSSARRVLGQRKVRGEWQGGGGAPPKDEARGGARTRLMRKWRSLQEEFGQQHRTLATTLRDEGAPAAQWRREFELALRYLPGDRQSHEALGDRQVGGEWVGAEDAAMVERLRGVADLAASLRGKEYDVTKLKGADMPVELQRTGLTMFGARSEHYTYWTAESYETAENLAQWSERAHELLRQLPGVKPELVRGEAWAWHCVLRTPEQRDLLLDKSPNTCGPFTADQARLFVGIGFRTEAGPRAAVTWEPAIIDQDYAVANVTKRHFLDTRNDGLGEGLVHTMTWLLCGTSNTYFADLPATVAGGTPAITRDPNKWFERLWQEIDERRDMPIAVVPRESPTSFRDSTRLKSWSFGFWVLGAYPDKWLSMIEATSNEQLTPPDVEATFRQVFGKSAEELDVEWRRWARRGSALGAASGWRPKE